MSIPKEGTLNAITGALVKLLVALREGNWCKVMAQIPFLLILLGRKPVFSYPAPPKQQTTLLLHPHHTYSNKEVTNPKKITITGVHCTAMCYVLRWVLIPYL